MKALTITDYKKQWVAARRAQLHARGLIDAEIAEQMGYKAPYVSQVFNGDKVGDKFIDKMCKAFGFRFIQEPEVAQSTKPGTITIGEEAFRDLVEQVKLLTRAVNSRLDQESK